MIEWLNDICHRIEGLLSNFAQYIQSNPKVGNLIAIFLLLFWLVGLILNWKWTYKYNPQNEMFLLLKTRCSVLKNETYPKSPSF